MRTLLAVLGLAAMIPCPAVSQSFIPQQNDGRRQHKLDVPPPTATDVTAVFVEEAPRIDGHLDEAIWDDIAPITRFIQVWPEDGAPATERSEVRVAYDRDHLYFAFQFYDDNPELIRAKNLERGGRNDRDDHAYIGLDTYLDRRNAYLFEMNALGTQDDATITDEGLTIDSFSWDAVFRSETVINDEGWSMEVSIPFRQLRFPKGEELEFGLMLSRMINRKNERVLWPRIGLEYGGSSFGTMAAVSQYGRLKGLKDIRRGKNIEIKPYVITGAQKSRTDLALEQTETDLTQDVGVDFKYGITSSLTLDLTVNTDFAQVEADNVQLNLTRFNLFFPEKREFFLERSGLFEHGNSQSTQTFFSRQIGLTEDILAGARLTGEVGPLSVGFLNIEEGDGMDELLGSRSKNNTVLRTRANVIPRGTIGGIFTNVQEHGVYNRSVGGDAQYRFWSDSEFSAWYTRVWDTNPLFDDAAGHARLQLQNDRYGGRVSFTSVGTNYRPALGFVRRRDMRAYTGRALWRPTVGLSSIRRLVFQADAEYIEGQDGEKQTTYALFKARAEFNRRDIIQIAVDHSFERLELPFLIRPEASISAGDYNFVTFGLNGETDASRRLFARAAASTGGFFDGNRTDFETGIGYRPSRHLTIEADVAHSQVDLPIDNGNFDATTISSSILTGLSRKLFAKALLQYDNFTRDIQANIRIDWIHTPGSDLFIVFNTSYHLTDDDEDIFDPRKDLVLNDRVGILKLTYLVLL